jgi:hypothetical protein
MSKTPAGIRRWSNPDPAPCAGYLPARRAAMVDPAHALKQD